MAIIIWITTFLSISATLVVSSPTLGAGLMLASAALDNPPIIFDEGNVEGVNFGGYHASPGLGRLFIADLARRGLHAVASAPYAQAAAAALGGVVGGAAAGGMYPGPASGARQVAAVGLGGVVAGGGAGGALYSAPQSGASPSGYIERTVIPNYVEKTINVPSYVEKTIRVPTIITKQVQVEAAPTVIEKTVEVPQDQVSSVVHSHWAHHPKPVFGGSFPGGGGGLYGGGGGVGASDFGGGPTYTGGKSVTQQLINGFFNIPINTLGAVKRLVGGIAGGVSASASFALNKQYGY